MLKDNMILDKCLILNPESYHILYNIDRSIKLFFFDFTECDIKLVFQSI